MRISKWVVGMVAVVVMGLAVQAGEETYLVKIKGLDKQTEMQVLTAAEYKALEATLKLEQKFFPAAIAQVAKEWRADEFNKGISFPGGKLSPRTIMTATKYSSPDKASEALAKIEEMQSKKEDREFKKKALKSKEQLKLESEIRSAMDLVKPALDALVAGKGGGAAGVEAPGGAKVNAAVDKAAK